MKKDLSAIYNQSIKNPEEFWGEVAKDVFWFKKPTKILNNSKQYELIIEDADSAIVSACEKSNAEIIDYTAGPIYMTDQLKGTHEWLIEFSNSPENIADFTVFLDESLKQSNSDYAAKRKGNINMGMPVIRAMPKGTFYNWLKNNGKLGGQHKIPRLSNNRKIIESILRNS